MRYLAPLLLGLSMMASAQQPKESRHEPGAQEQSATPDCKGMMAKMQQHHSGMKQMDEKLQARIAAMNQASGDAKVDAVAEAVTLLAQQRIQMHEGMMAMDNERSQHMMSHMQQGERGMKAMMECPMMQQKTKQKSK